MRRLFLCRPPNLGRYPPTRKLMAGSTLELSDIWIPHEAESGFEGHAPHYATLRHATKISASSFFLVSQWSCYRRVSGFWGVFDKHHGCRDGATRFQLLGMKESGGVGCSCCASMIGSQRCFYFSQSKEDERMPAYVDGASIQFNFLLSSHLA